MDLSKLNTRLAEDWYEREIELGVAPQEDFDTFVETVNEDKQAELQRTYWKRRIATATVAGSLLLGAIEAAPSVADTVQQEINQIIDADDERFIQEYGPEAVNR